MRPDQEEPKQFESRKEDHIRLSLDPKTEASGLTRLDQIELLHEALPELDLEDVSMKVKTLGFDLRSPMFISSMTAGHPGSGNINEVMASACQARGWAMGVGSQRRELTDPDARKEWQDIRKKAPNTIFFGNIGISQLIVSKVSEIQTLVDSLNASALFVHTNPIQECFQPEGTPHFKGCTKAIENLCKALTVPVIIKETGTGFSKRTLKRLMETGVAAVDVSGLGGTHWGRIEGGRSQENSKLGAAAETFKNWGISTVDSLLNGVELKPNYELWASGGVRSGLDAAKLIAMGANMIGLARPILEAAIKGPEELNKRMELLEYELKTALFCTGCKNLSELQENGLWKYRGR